MREGLWDVFVRAIGGAHAGNERDGMDVEEGRDEMMALRCLVLIGHGKAGEKALEMWATKAEADSSRGVGAYIHYNISLILSLIKISVVGTHS